VAKDQRTSFKDDNKQYETWLREQCDVVERDLRAKHKKMRKNAFTFLRGTYFRWAATIEDLCPELKEAPKVLAVGDLHIENFGTWRDAEGRLVWGINDFDEAAPMPYAFDLVRLVTSARLAPGMRVADKTIAKAVLAGYRRGIKASRPTLLDEHDTWMREFVGTTAAEHEEFWNDVKKLPTDNDIPADVRRCLDRSCPKEAEVLRYTTREAGVGSLGRPRYAAIAQLRLGQIVREAKALVPSAWYWAHDRDARKDPPSHLLEAARSEYRSPDPHLNVDRDLVVRRLAADAIKIEFKVLPKKALQADLFDAMGFELGACHGGSRKGVASVRTDLDHRRGDWLHDAANRAEAAVRADLKEWKRE
jgi:Uncharacterized protein conserved in bacteria (DUF2252)